MTQQLGRNQTRIAMRGDQRRVGNATPRFSKPRKGVDGPDESIGRIPKDRRGARLNGLRNEAPAVGFATRRGHENVAGSH